MAACYGLRPGFLQARWPRSPGSVWHTCGPHHTCCYSYRTALHAPQTLVLLLSLCEFIPLWLYCVHLYCLCRVSRLIYGPSSPSYLLSVPRVRSSLTRQAYVQPRYTPHSVFQVLYFLNLWVPCFQPVVSVKWSSHVGLITVLLSWRQWHAAASHRHITSLSQSLGSKF